MKPLHASSISNWQELEGLIDEALDAPQAERRALLAERCAGNDAMYDAAIAWLGACEDDSGFLNTPFDVEAGLEIGSRVGAWRVLGEIGRGGMGTVYQAERADLEMPMKAAIKFMHRAISFDAVGVRRFRDERRILAALEHPSIARLLDGGVSDGQSWFAMEFVNGAPIDSWCDERTLSIAARVALFCRVCEAVQHAHARLVVHRDLKPANILVTDSGDPKLLDFGIAKLLADAEPENSLLTRPGMQPMTVSYAAPEQLQGAAPSTTTDIYSLGVLLHVLLTGQLPREGMRASAVVFARPESDTTEPDFVARVVRARRSTSSRIERQLRGDLDVIVARALHADQQRRYPTADAFAADLRRHLEGRPVLARPDTATYRLRKLISRHPIGSVVTVAGVALFVAFTSVTFVQSRRLRAQADELLAQAKTLTAERDKATDVTEFLTDVISSADPYQPSGRVPNMREVLDRGAANAASQLSDRPEILAQLYGAMAPAYFGFGDLERAGNLAEQAVQLWRRAKGPADSSVGAALLYLANVRLNQKRAKDAEAETREALSIFNRVGNTAHSDIASAMSILGSALRQQGRLTDAEVVLRNLLESERAYLPHDASRVAQVARNLGHVLRDKHSYVDALPLYQEAYNAHLALYGPEHPETANSAVNLGYAHSLVGNAVAAESLLRAGVATKRRLLGISHPDAAGDQLTLSRVLAKNGKTKEAESLRKEAEQVLKRSGSP
ncbi:MAG: serine/threonine-protein kinase [Gemmatimonadaceae bacterium]